MPPHTYDTQHPSRSQGTPNPNTEDHAASPPFQLRADQLKAKIAKRRKEEQGMVARLEKACRALEELNQRQVTCTSSTPQIQDGALSYLAEHSATVKEAKATVQRQVRLLTKYNETKDAAMGLLKVIAESEAKTVREIMDERSVEDD